MAYTLNQCTLPESVKCVAALLKRGTSTITTRMKSQDRAKDLLHLVLCRTLARSLLRRLDYYQILRTRDLQLLKKCDEVISRTSECKSRALAEIELRTVTAVNYRAATASEAPRIVVSAPLTSSLIHMDLAVATASSIATSTFQE